jgi:uncharacterized SAM-binding protein YcdF (DUF218 family)
MYTLLTMTLLQPLAVLLIVVGVGLFRARRVGKDGVARRPRLALTAWALLYLISTPAVVHLAQGSLEWLNPPLAQRPGDVEAIVVLGAGQLGANELRPWCELDHTTQGRCKQAAVYYHQGPPCPVVASGGNTPPDPPVAEEMSRFLKHLGVRDEDLIVEGRSLSTWQNAEECARLLRERGLHRILLVTDATHMPRAAACFRAQGLEVVPGGAYHQATGWAPALREFLPSADDLEDFHDVWHEWVGLAWYRLRGRI